MSADLPAVFAPTDTVALVATGGPIQVGGFGLATQDSPVYVPAGEADALCAEGKLTRWVHMREDDEKPRKRGKEK